MTFDSDFSVVPYHDRNAVGLSHYQFPFCPSGAGPYRRLPVDDDARSAPNFMRRLTDERLQCNRNLGWSIDWATAFLVDHLDPNNSPDVSDTLRKISIRASQLTQEGRRKQVVYRAFGTLNQILFAGHLKDAVYLSFAHLGPDTSGATYSQGQGPNRRVQRISILLNLDLLPTLTGPHLISSLIHHMIHAYFLVACGPQKEKEVPYGRLGHGMPFAKIMKTIKELGRSRGRVWLPGLSIIPRASRRYGYDGYDRYDDYDRARSPRDAKQDWFSSHCPAKLTAIPACDVEKWYGGICKPLLDLPDTVKSSTVTIFNKRNQLEEVRRAEVTPSSDSVEFLFEDQPFLVAGDKIDNFISVRRAFEKLGHRYLEVHEDVSKEGFLLLLELLNTGTYAPDIGPVVGSGRQGPPVIKPTRPASPPYLINDITLFKTGVKMGFEDLIGFAIGRMRAQCITHEDPVTILSAIYSGKDPHPDIRQWAKDFLIQAPPNDADWGIVGRTGDAESPNLAKLKMEMCFRERFVELMNKCGSLHIDVLKAEELLVANGRMGTRSPVRGLLAAPYGVPMANAAALVTQQQAYGGMAGLNMGVPVPVPVTMPPRALGPGVGLGVGAVPGLGAGGLAWREEMDEYGRYRDEVDAAAAYAARLGIGGEDRWGY